MFTGRVRPAAAHREEKLAAGRGARAAGRRERAAGRWEPAAGRC